MPIVTCSHLKGGVGKTTVVVNVAAALSRLGLTTVVVDIDRSTQSATRMQVGYQEAGEGAPMPRTLPPIENLGAAISSAVTQGAMRVDMVVASKLSELERQYDVVLVDASAGATAENFSAVRVSQLVLVPVTSAHLDFQTSAQYINECEQFAATNGQRPLVRAVLNRFQPRQKADAELLEIVLNPDSGIRAYSGVIPVRASISQLSANGATVFDGPARGLEETREAFLQVAREIKADLGLKGSR